jgi:hypothetical protein
LEAILGRRQSVVNGEEGNEEKKQADRVFLLRSGMAQGSGPSRNRHRCRGLPCQEGSDLAAPQDGIDPPHQQSVPSGLRFSPDGRRLFAASGSGIVQIWEVETGKTLAAIETGSGESRRGNAGRTALFRLSPAATRLYAKKGPDIGVWDTETGRLVDTLKTESRRGIRSLIVSPDGKALIAAESGKDAAGSLWDLAARQARPLPKGLAAASGALSRDGKFFAAPVRPAAKKSLPSRRTHRKPRIPCCNTPRTATRSSPRAGRRGKGRGRRNFMPTFAAQRSSTSWTSAASSSAASYSRKTR